MAAGFSRISAGVLTGCLGALDGLLIPIECPRQARDFGGQEACYNPLSYYCRKGFYAVNVQAICDAHCRFSYVSVQTPGTTRDSLAFSLCDAYDLLTKSALSATLASLVTRVSVPYGHTRTSVPYGTISFWARVLPSTGK